MNSVQVLAQEAHKIHDSFFALFYGIVTILLLVSVLLEYFKWPIGGIPSFGPLVGRALVAAILLYSYPEVSNTVSDVSDSLCQRLGDLNQFKPMLERLSQKLQALTWSWTSVRESLIALISYLSFFVLYLSIHIAKALHLFTVTILYIFSPLLIALYVLPATAGATSALYRSLFEASMWKPVWSVLATLLWSTGVSEIGSDGSQISILTAICFCVLAAAAVITTPTIVHLLAGAGLHSMTHSLGRMGVDGVQSFTAKGVATQVVGHGFNAGRDISDHATRSRFPKLNEKIRAIPKMNVRPPKALFKKERKDS